MLLSVQQRKVPFPLVNSRAICWSQELKIILRPLWDFKGLIISPLFLKVIGKLMKDNRV
jgi:hypothetical protein